MTSHIVSTVERPTGFRVLVDGRPVGIVGRGVTAGNASRTAWYGVAYDGTRRYPDGTKEFTPGQAVRWVARHYLTARGAA
jgi:hypothetical protein